MTSKGSGIRLVVFDEQQLIAPSICNVMIESVKSFHELSSCISFINQQAEENQVVILITTVDDNDILEIFESLTPIEAIFVLSKEEREVDPLPSKVIGVYIQIDTLLRSIPETIDRIEQELNSRSILFHRQIHKHDNPDFYFYYFWKQYNQNEKSTKTILTNQSRLLFQSNNKIQSFINDFETLYKSRHVLMWIDKHYNPFPYHLLISHALRTHNQKILSLSQCFIRNLDHQLIPAPSDSTYNQVYLGTKLPIDLADRLEQYRKTDIIAFQCFLSVTQSRLDALMNATKPSRREQIMNVLFKIELNGTLCIIKGDTILIDMATPFHIKYVMRSPGSGVGDQPLLIVKLTAFDSSEKIQLFEQFKSKYNKLENKSRKTVTIVNDNEILADDHILRGEWTQAATILARIPNPNVRVLNKYGCLLREYLHNLPLAFECHQKALLKANNREKAEIRIYLGKVYQSMKQYTQAFDSYSQSLTWFENQQKRNPIMITRCLICLGNIQHVRRRLDDAVDYIQRALDIHEHEIKPRNDFDVAACLENLGRILHDQGNVERALSCAKRAVDLLNKCGKDDPCYIAGLNNLGAMYLANGNSIKARECFQHAIDIAELNITRQSNK